ncbi:MAG TPA: sodium:proton antiporter [Kofleriaceae bacterium]|jgi:CPA1 family monovalent cation:H+ antiporter
MTTIQIAALFISLTALLAYINARFIRLPSQVGMLAIALAGSLAVVGLDAVGIINAAPIQHIVGQAEFGRTLLHGMLGLLLFAGALHINVDELAQQRWPIGALSLGGTLLSTLLVGVATYAVLSALGHDIGLPSSLLFGALISPTDPIAVLGVLKTSKVPSTLAVQISGESLFNDGIGVVLFTVLLAIGTGEHLGAGDVVVLFARQAIGGAAFGFVLGYVGSRMLQTIDDYTVEVLVTLAIVLGGYAVAEAIHVSGPIGAVVSGIVVGNRPRTKNAMQVGLFWELIDETLNAVLFLMLGLEATRLHVSLELAIAALIAVPLALAARAVSVGVSVTVLRPFGTAPAPHAIKILTWGGLRGGLAVALALSIPEGPYRDTILVMTYAVVAFSILAQGLTLSRLLRHLGL